MKLTNAIRDAFIRAAMDDVPQTDYKSAATKMLQEWADKQALPLNVQVLLADENTRHFVESYTEHFKYTDDKTWRGDHVSYIAYGDDDLWPQVPAPVAKRVKAEMANHKKQQTQRDELRGKLRAAAYSVTTRKALVELLPEFEKYLPLEVASTSRRVPVVIQNVVADFVKAGWPKPKAA